FTSVLPRALTFESNKALYTWAFYDSLSYDSSQLGIGLVPAPGVSLEEAEAALDEAIAAFMEEGVDTEQFERVKFQLRASLIYAEDSVQGLARRYGNALTSGLTVDDVEAWPEVLAAVTPEDVMAAAERVFDRSRSVTGWARPATPAEEVTQ
ncbi:MAG: insulinase family protein, partial [Pseudomonadota bacterium]